MHIFAFPQEQNKTRKLKPLSLTLGVNAFYVFSVLRSYTRSITTVQLMSCNSLSHTNPIVCQSWWWLLRFPGIKEWCHSFSMRPLENTEEWWMKCSHIHGFHLIWPDSSLCGVLHLNQMFKVLTAVNEDLINRVKRAWCLHSIPMHREVEHLSCHRVCQGVFRVDRYDSAMLPCVCPFCSDICGQLVILRNNICLYVGNWMNPCCALNTANEGIVFSYTSMTVYCQRQDWSRRIFAWTRCNNSHVSTEIATEIILTLFLQVTISYILFPSNNRLLNN